jgi:hypothetical protein
VNGRGRGALIGISLLVAFVVGVRFVRKKMNLRKAAPAENSTSG